MKTMSMRVLAAAFTVGAFTVEVPTTETSEGSLVPISKVSFSRFDPVLFRQHTMVNAYPRETTNYHEVIESCS